MKPSNSLTIAIDQLFPSRPNLPNGVDTASLALEVGTHEHFPDQADREKHQTSKPEHCACDEQWTVLRDDVMSPDFLEQNTEQDDSAQANAGEPPFTEEVHRTSEIAEEKTDGKDVE